jgi:hypothetical protein
MESYAKNPKVSVCTAVCSQAAGLWKTCYVYVYSEQTVSQPISGLSYSVTITSGLRPAAVGVLPQSVGRQS